MWTDLDSRAVDTVRVLAADAVQKVGNGHPGTAMSLAPAAYLLFQRFLAHDPADPDWLGRDRFVLSCGHSSLTLYLQLFLSGYGLELSDLEAFRTWGSLTPGHPERHHTRGVETTTGPLGQGLSTAVGMAMGQRYERGLLDPDAAPGTSPFDHHVWVICSDGDLEEGITSEASSLAGTQRLGNLTVVWDDNKISIEDDTAVAFSEDVRARYAAYGWHVQSVDVLPDGSVDVLSLATALEAARAETDAPVLHPARVGHRLARPPPAQHLQGPRLGARCRRGRGDEGDPRLRPGPELRRGRRRARPHPRGEGARCVLARSLGQGLRRVARGQHRPRGPARSARRRDAPGGLRPAGVPRGQGRGDPQGQRRGHPGDRLLCCPSSSAAAPTSPRATTRPSRAAVRSCPRARSCPPPRRSATSSPPTGGSCTSASASTPWAPRSTACRCRASCALRRHLPGLQRLHARRRAHRRGDADGRHVRLDPRLHRPRRGRPDPPAGRAPLGAARDPGPRRRPPADANETSACGARSCAVAGPPASR